MRLALSLPTLNWRLPTLSTGGRPYDPLLLISSISLLLIGFLMITSASMEVSNENYGSPFYHAFKHGVFIVVALVAAIVTLLVPMDFWQRTGHWWLLVGFALLVVVLVPGIGREVNGSTRWIRMGPLNLQASELAKLFMVLYMGGYLVRRLDEVRTQWSGFVKPMAVLSLFICLLLLEPDFGAVVVMGGTVLGMIFLSGMVLWQFLLVVMGAIAAAVVMVVSSPYRWERVTSFMDPFADPFGAGYQLAQAQIAFGRGEWFGLGLGNSVQKLFYLPEAHTDFVFSVLAEELGLVGALVVILLYALMIIRVFYIGRRAEEQGMRYHGYVAYGIGIMFAGQALINIGVNAGVLPTKGLTLPLVSYGGSSLLVCLVMLAILCRIQLERYRQQNSTGSKKAAGTSKRSKAAGAGS
ncbi:putative lipid II flippase FtsW [Motiliproteus coralliicola]|uniref:Probable peptidoglycan glycosyltransferase FtsW n=1 Tax=Motiliproteus coralliicola TaxID=2283196 RepID=A0A369WMR7_9GAMM|nr:putative lipid II flippase FtsW [Motiliproteus coralliicola]RDE22791.1 putative lipid II flippase FtsW [Motiliproteus coralliicola]